MRESMRVSWYTFHFALTTVFIWSNPKHNCIVLTTKKNQYSVTELEKQDNTRFMLHYSKQEAEQNCKNITHPIMWETQTSANLGRLCWFNFFLHLWGYKTLIIHQNDNISPLLCAKNAWQLGLWWFTKQKWSKSKCLLWHINNSGLIGEKICFSLLERYLTPF